MPHKFKNLIETNYDAGVTAFSGHQPSLLKGSLSNKGQLSAWRTIEVPDLNSMVQALYYKGPKLTLSDSLSRVCSQPNEGLYGMLLPQKVEVLLQRLFREQKEVDKIIGHFHKDTTIINSQIQKR